jgi:hypothetical protein
VLFGNEETQYHFTHSSTKLIFILMIKKNHHCSEYQNLKLNHWSAGGKVVS